MASLRARARHRRRLNATERLLDQGHSLGEIAARLKITPSMAGKLRIELRQQGRDAFDQREAVQALLAFRGVILDE